MPGAQRSGADGRGEPSTPPIHDGSSPAKDGIASWWGSYPSAILGLAVVIACPLLILASGAHLSNGIPPVVISLSPILLIGGLVISVANVATASVGPRIIAAIAVLLGLVSVAFTAFTVVAFLGFLGHQ